MPLASAAHGTAAATLDPTTVAGPLPQPASTPRIRFAPSSPAPAIMHATVSYTASRAHRRAASAAAPSHCVAHSANLAVTFIAYILRPRFAYTNRGRRIYAMNV